MTSTYALQLKTLVLLTIILNVYNAGVLYSQSLQRTETVIESVFNLYVEQIFCMDSFGRGECHRLRVHLSLCFLILGSVFVQKLYTGFMSSVYGLNTLELPINVQ